jgi:hypothetical protein
MLGRKRIETIHLGQDQKIIDQFLKVNEVEHQGLLQILLLFLGKLLMEFAEGFSGSAETGQGRSHIVRQFTEKSRASGLHLPQARERILDGSSYTIEFRDQSQTRLPKTGGQTTAEYSFADLSQDVLSLASFAPEKEPGEPHHKDDRATAGSHENDLPGEEEAAIRFISGIPGPKRPVLRAKPWHFHPNAVPTQGIVSTPGFARLSCPCCLQIFGNMSALTQNMSLGIEQDIMQSRRRRNLNAAKEGRKLGVLTVDASRCIFRDELQKCGMRSTK